MKQQQKNTHLIECNIRLRVRKKVAMMFTEQIRKYLICALP